MAIRSWLLLQQLSMMIILAIMAIIMGALVGQRFKVFVLFPAIAVGSAITFGIGMAHGDGVWSVLLAMVLAISALQIGYLGGVVIRLFGAGVQARKHARQITGTV